MQILYPGTREQELLFDTNLDGVSGFIVADRQVLLPTMHCNVKLLVGAKKSLNLFDRTCTHYRTRRTSSF